MAKKQFKAESKRLLDLMINSIYTHKEIFLRELISNGSDAIDKLYYRSLTEGNTGISREDFKITIEPDKENRTLKVIDNGIGMTKEELESNLGVIARSGSLDFKEANETGETKGAGKTNGVKEDIDIIGQFGVGFYSSFMVSEKVTVESKAYGEETAYRWESSGTDGYTIKECEKETVGTEITLKIKESTEDESYDSYLDTYGLRTLVTRYSDYIRYPIQMMVEKQKPKETTEEKESSEKEGKEVEYESYQELETLNSMVPIWKKKKSELKDEDYNEFYKEKFHDFTDPMKVIHSSVEGVSSYDALLFIPSQAPYNYYTKEYEKGLQLYSSGVLIMDKCPDLLPDYFSFVKGLADSQDLSLNISREMLQHDRQLRAIAVRLEKKIKSELLAMLNADREKYLEFFKNFGLQLKYGLYEKFGANKDNLQDLVLFYSSTEKALVTLAEYVSRMKEDQKHIYYASGETTDKIDKLPQTEFLKDEGYEILYLTEDIDEFCLQVVREFEGKEFKSVSADDLDLKKSEDEEKNVEEHKELLAFIKESLGEKISDVQISHRLKSHPVCLTTSGGLSIEMEKVLNAMPTDEKIKAEKVLEINGSHPVLKALAETFKADKDTAASHAEILYNQALLIEGLPIEDPVAYSNAVCQLITK